MRRIVRPAWESAAKSNGAAVHHAEKAPGHTVTAPAPNGSSDVQWIKPAIADILKTQEPDRDVRVDVGNVKYGSWIWDESTGVLGHFSVKDLAADLGRKAAKQLVSELPVVILTWDQLKARRGAGSKDI